MIGYLMGNEMGRMWQYLVVAFVEELYRHLS
jgi:hypothetical protein